MADTTKTQEEPKKEMTLLEVVKEVDGFPYERDDPEHFKQYMSKFHAFKINGCDHVLGYMPTEIMKKWDWEAEEHWKIDNETRTLTLLCDKDAKPEHRTELLHTTLRAAHEKKIFDVIKGNAWRDESYPIYHPVTKKLLASIERAAACLFGLPTWGIHMTAYYRDKKTREPILWIATRSEDKPTFPLMLDNTVAGGMATNQGPFECMLKESMEEAKFGPEVAKNAECGGCLTYIYVRDERAGGEKGLLQPEHEYIYDLELDEKTIPGVDEEHGEVQGFEAMNIEKVIRELRAGKFKPNCASVVIDFLMRHNQIKPDEESDYAEISARLHRRLGYPLS
ncbi:hypothetical protein AJ79_07655 [Helicocarpus griseus UAMH5409]|uniref:Nudix hydrolase domain-containing protein n=1 Tax=Helicocarpus griseus UAMH5409 TaxID=1447875 RepID=A0A2B7X0V2_9EURO|nr:hypothetical protein AJ79_07655 [Helicocarpus griseus UAMH5409]